MPDLHICPIVLDGTSAILTCPKQKLRRDTGILLCRAWAHDELCSRKFYKVLADRIAASGFPALRFDYPGTVDSCDPDDDRGLESWVDAADKCADALRETGCRTIVTFAFSLGCLISQGLIRRRDDISGAVLAAPVVSGRRYIREINLREKMLFETESIPLTRLNSDRTSLLGNVMPEQVVKDIKSITLEAPDITGRTPVLLFARQNTKSDLDCRDKLEAVSNRVTVCDFHEYNDLTNEVLTSKVPRNLIETTTEWLAETQTPPIEFPDLIDPEPFVSSLENERYLETTEYLQIDGKRLLTVVTRPTGNVDRAPVYILGNTGGYDHRGGLGRESVEVARTLADLGAVAVRFDDVNTGDSYPDLPEGQEILYSDEAIRSLQSVIEHACRHFGGPVTLVGRCSSAYTALHAAAHDPRVRQLILVNQLKFIWDKDVPNELKNMMARSGGEYKKRLADPQTVQRLLKGDIDILAACLGVLRVLVKKISEKTADHFPRMSKLGTLRLEALTLFKILRNRDIKIHFLCSSGDGSIEELKAHFGSDLRGMSSFPNIEYSTIEDADHRLMPVHARKRFIALIAETLQSRWMPSHSRHSGITTVKSSADVSSDVDSIPTV